MTTMRPWMLRAAFARRLSALYGAEVPAYTTLVEVAHEVNRDVVADLGASAERLGGIERVTAERHGAVRVGTPHELAQLARIFGAMGMRPVGYYDLRDAAPTPVPVVSTAFRPVDPDELARNPFRVFVSLLATADRRFFTPELAARLEAFLERRRLFPPRLLELAERAERREGLDTDDAAEFLDLATASFRLSREPIDRRWYGELEAVSPVAADIGGLTSTHINHLTPRVLDIDALYERMRERGIEMIDTIQGPPRWDGPQVLLRQTSFRALSEERRFAEADGRTSTGSLRVRFGEVEARGIALSARGRDLYDRLLAEADLRSAADPARDRAEVMRAVWEREFPATETELAAEGLGAFTFTAVTDRPRDGRPPENDLRALLDAGWLTARPIVYEDFLPRSAAGIFRSNLTSAGSRDAAEPGADLDSGWLAGVLGRPLADPSELYERRHSATLTAALDRLGIRRPPEAPAGPVHQADPTTQPTPSTTTAGVDRDH
ncbi:2-oxoadipate dioxygenase/decarboxylase family protein [Actinomadura viridis]|uniref:2-oxoadipate dioxygenase/decarboxylase n=1 Tax=Actinomadura viridis TaxID=58110 RepID=UPI0036CBBDB7